MSTYNIKKKELTKARTTTPFLTGGLWNHLPQGAPDLVCIVHHKSARIPGKEFLEVLGAYMCKTQKGREKSRHHHLRNVRAWGAEATCEWKCTKHMKGLAMQGDPVRTWGMGGAHVNGNIQSI